MECRSKQRIPKRENTNGWEVLKVSIREMQIKTTLSFHLIPVRVTKINLKMTVTRWWGCGGKGALIHYWWELKLIQSHWKSVWWSRRKLGIHLSEDPPLPLLGIYSKDSTSSIMFIYYTLFIIATNRKQSRCPSKDKEYVAHLHGGIWLNSSKAKSWNSHVNGWN